MKKLFIYALLAMTGFAFYSCDERFDNPVTQQQDPSNPNATWIYEVNIDFAAVPINYYDEAEEVWKGYENPTTVWVFNQDFEELGILTTDEDGELFTGSLHGAIGDTLIISTIEDFDYTSKQDGTRKTLIQNCVLQTAKVPIIVKNATTGKIGTQKVTMKNQVAFFHTELDEYAWIDDNNMTISSENFVIDVTGKVDKNSFNIKLAEGIDPYTDIEGFDYAASIKDENEETKWIITNNSEHGYISEGVRSGNYKNGEYISRWFSMSNLRSIDLTKYYEFQKKRYEENNWVIGTIYVNIRTLPGEEAIVTQSGEEALPIQLYVNQAKNISLKDINVKYMHLGGNYSVKPENEYDYRPVITLEGKNIIGSEDNYEDYGLDIASAVTFKGSGSLEADGNNRGIVSWNTYQFSDEEGTDKWLPCGITLEDNVSIISKNEVQLNGWTSGEDKIQNYITINGGSFDAIAKSDWEAPIYLNGGKITIGTDSKGLTAKSKTTYYIYDGSTNDEATLESLVEDKTKFTDETKDGVRTIKKK